MILQGHPKPMIYMPFESQFATAYYWSMAT